MLTKSPKDISEVLNGIFTLQRQDVNGICYREAIPPGGPVTISLGNGQMPVSLQRFLEVCLPQHARDWGGFFT